MYPALEKQNMIEGRGGRERESERESKRARDR
jgi:hypothetical protein